MRKLVAVVVGVSALLVTAPSAMAEPGTGGCLLEGTARFDAPGLGAHIHAEGTAFSYSFSGTLSNCASSLNAPASAAVQAGQAIGANGETYDMPKGQGQGGCGSSTTTGTALISWADGTKTLTNYSTTGATSGIALTGSVIESITLPPRDGSGPSLTITTNRFNGASIGGPLAFTTNTPEKCMSGGLSEATITGVQTLVDSN